MSANPRMACPLQLTSALLAARTSFHDRAEGSAIGTRVVIRICVAKSRFKNEMTLASRVIGDCLEVDHLGAQRRVVFMKVFRILIVLSLMLLGGIAFGMNVKTDYDRSFDFGRLKSFALTDRRTTRSPPARRAPRTVRHRFPRPSPPPPSPSGRPPFGGSQPLTPLTP